MLSALLASSYCNNALPWWTARRLSAELKFQEFFNELKEKVLLLKPFHIAKMLKVQIKFKSVGTLIFYFLQTAIIISLIYFKNEQAFLSKNVCEWTWLIGVFVGTYLKGPTLRATNNTTANTQVDFLAVDQLGWVVFNNKFYKKNKMLNLIKNMITVINVLKLV